MLYGYWVKDEAEFRVIIENEIFYWKHPTLTAPITLKDVDDYLEYIHKAWERVSSTKKAEIFV